MSEIKFIIFKDILPDSCVVADFVEYNFVANMAATGFLGY